VDGKAEPRRGCRESRRTQLSLAEYIVDGYNAATSEQVEGVGLPGYLRGAGFGFFRFRGTMNTPQPVLAWQRLAALLLDIAIVDTARLAAR
jgi:hypothetical protein